MSEERGERLQRGERLREEMQAADRPRLWPNQRPRDAATLILLDHSGDAPTVLMGRRHEGHRFMPGKFVFPGGRLERQDRFMGSCSELRPEVEARLAARVGSQSSGRGRALALTALRETYEETGLLIGREQTAAPSGRRPSAAWLPFHEAGILPDLASVTFLGRAVTPPRRPKRFDTRFFVADRRHVRREVPGFVGPDKELVELCWVSLEAAQRLDLPRVTSIMLKELDHRLAEGLEADRPVPFYREERGRFLREEL